MHRPQLSLSAIALSLTLTACATAPAGAPAAAPPAPGSSAAPAPAPTIAAKTAGLERRPGLLDLFIDARQGRVWAALPAPGADGTVGSYIYVHGLLTGLGSNPVGLDRGELGDAAILTLRRVGGRVLFEQPNLRFRARSENPDEQRAVRESFATSVLWAGEIAAEDPDGRLLVDLTPFLLRDAHEVVAALRASGQGSWTLDAARSTVDPAACLAFPDNVELESVLTFQSAEPGSLVRETVPAAGAVTLVQHQSLIKLPDAGYRPRAWDARAGSYGVSFLDYAVPLDVPLETRWIARHRLPGEPLVFYVDSGAPEPVRSALLEGASWWAEAFDKAGLPGAYRVEILPPGIHPLDARYNVIQWVHRSTRGWSYGGGVVDPRTGELVKGHVTLGSQRVRQDRLLFEGLAGVAKTGTGAPDDPVQLALARIRQLAAHEVGHSLGLAHNFAASTYGRASVMDYPAPLVAVTPAGELDFSAAYATGVGEWDLLAVRYAYGDFGADPAAERAALDALLRAGIARGLVFLTDEDARSEASAQPIASLWDNLADPVAGLERALAVRRIALGRFGEGNIAAGRPLAYLEEVLAPVYFHHRYQVDAALKPVGGLAYVHALRGDGQPGPRPVAAADQRRALAALLDVLDPAVLDLPERVLGVLPPRPPRASESAPPSIEVFGARTAPVFDALGAAATAADQVVAGLLQPARAARLVDFHRRDPRLPGLEEVLDGLVERAFGGPAPAGPRQAELRRTVQGVVVYGLIRLARDPAASPAVQARAEGALRRLRDRIAGETRGADGDTRAYLSAEIGRHLERRAADPAPFPAPLPPPPGPPIGGGSALGDEGCAWGAP